MKKKTLLSLFLMLVSLISWSQEIRLHANYPEYNKRQGSGNIGMLTVPSDNKIDWVEGDVIFFIIDGGSGDKGFKATYDGAKWSFAEWFKNGGMQDFNPAGGTVSFAMNGDILNLTTMKPSNLDVSKTALQNLIYYAGGKIGDLLFTNTGTYTVDENGVVDIFLNFMRPMAKIHINGAYLAATQIRNQIEGTMPGGVDNAGGTNANYNKSKTMTLGQIIRYQPSTQTFRDANSGNGLNGTANMVYATRSDEPYIIDAVYYGNMEQDENGDITIVMCQNARTYPGIEANAALGSSGQVAYWRKFPGMTINPNDDIYIYGPMSEEEGSLWTSQAITGEMNFTASQLTLAENQQIALKPYCKWKAPAPTDRTLKFEISNPDIVSISEDGSTLYTHGIGTSTITATTLDGYFSTMTVSVKNVQELIDVSRSTWGTHITTTYNVGWRFVNNTVVDLTVTRAAMLAQNPDTGDYEEVASADSLNLLARSNNGTAYSTLNIKEDNIKDLPASKLRISYVYNGNTYTIDVPFKGIAINNKNFPDENFRNWILKQDYGADGILTGDEIENVTTIEVNNLEIKSLKGIEYFEALTTLKANSNQLTSLDVSKNTALTWLEFNSNQVTSLDVSNNRALTYLRCSGNALTSIDVSKNTALTTLLCGGNPITSLDVSNNTALNILYCHLSKLTSLDLSKNTELTTLMCHQNQIKDTGMDALIASLPTVSQGTMYVIYGEDEGNVMTPAQVTAAKAKGWIPACNYDKSGWVIYGGYSPSMSEKFPDPNFCNYLLCQSYGADGDITDEEFANITSLSVSGRKIKSLQGIEYFTALTSLYCYNNQLTSLDLSGCTALSYLSCDSNQLTSLDLSGCTALTELYCYANQLTSLDFSQNTALTELYCYNNQLTSLDVSKNTALTTLYCYSNQLTSLDVSTNTTLKKLACNNNQLSSIDLSNNTALTGLWCYDNQLTSLDVSKNTALATLSCYSNQLTSLDVPKDTALTTLYCYNNQLTSLDVSGCTALTRFDCYNNQLTSLDVSKSANLAALYCYNNLLTSLDVSENTNLATLYCYSNQLTSLDVSKCTALTYLACNNNKLTLLNLSENPALARLYCYDNQLTSLDVSNNTVLTSLACFKNQIKDTEMDALIESLPTANSIMYVIYNEDEGNVMDSEQVKMANTKGWIPYYYDGNDWQEYSGNEPGLRGDVNGDGEIGMPDVMFVVNYILGTPADTFNADAADANLDGEIGMPDVMYIVQYLLNGKFPDE